MVQLIQDYTRVYLMFGDGSLTFREFTMHEKLPLATIQDAVLDFLRGRTDAALFGAQAVNAYVDQPRMTQDVDILSPRAEELANDLKNLLHDKFHIAIKVRNIKNGTGYRIYQVREPKNRHLVDVRSVQQLPPTQQVDEVAVLTPVELIAGKVIAMMQRQGKPKAGSDWRDLAELLLIYPELKTTTGPITQRLQLAIADGTDSAILTTWKDLVKQPIHSGNDDDEF
jgi:hypothetical protein